MEPVYNKVNNQGVPQKVPEHELPKHLELHQALQILIDRRRVSWLIVIESARDRATIEKTYMVETPTPASMAAEGIVPTF